MTTEATTVSGKDTSSNASEELHDIQGLRSAESNVNLTDSAAAKVKELLDQQAKSDLALRVAARPGGCSGLQYQLFFDDQEHEADDRFELNGVQIVIDHMSGPYLAGATIDFVESVDKQGFTIDNPSAAPSGGGCGCGSEGGQAAEQSGGHGGGHGGGGCGGGGGGGCGCG